MLTLGRGDAGAAHGPALWSAGHWRAAVLPAQAEQAVLPGGQAEARQGQRVDLLLGQVGRQLLINCGRLCNTFRRLSLRRFAEVLALQYRA